MLLIWVFLFLVALDKKGRTDFVRDMHDLCHIEAIENAFVDIGGLIVIGKLAWQVAGFRP